MCYHLACRSEKDEMKEENDKTKKALAAVIAANVIWGFSFMATSVALKHISVPALLSMRFTGSFLIMLAVMICGRAKVSIKGKPVGLFLLMGLCEPVIYFIAESYGVKHTTSSFSGLTLSLIPITTAVLSAVILGEHLSAKKLLWITCSVAGVALISVSQTNEGTIEAKGVFYLLISMVAASFFSILSRHVSGSFTSFERTFIMMLMGCAAFTALALVREGPSFGRICAAALSQREVLLPLLFLSVVCSVFAFFCLNYGMTYLEVSRAVVFTNITPVVSVIAGTVLLGEPFSAVCAAGMFLILTGLFMVNRIRD